MKGGRIFNKNVFRNEILGFTLVAVGALFLCCGVVWASGLPPELKVNISQPSKPGSGAGTSVLFKLVPLPQGSTGLLPVRTLQVSGGLGALNLKGIPTCRPRAGSTTSGCSAPSIGTGRVFAYSQYEAEGDIATKQHGTVELFSGGQEGADGKLYGWVHFRGVEVAQSSSVISMTVRRIGPGRSELTAVVPELEGGRVTIAELLLSLHGTVRVDGRSITVTQANCPSAAPVYAEASFYGSANPIVSQVTPRCTRH
jgi:hypothetical protein